MSRQMKAGFLAVQHLRGLSGFGWDYGLKMLHQQRRNGVPRSLRIVFVELNAMASLIISVAANISVLQLGSHLRLPNVRHSPPKSSAQFYPFVQRLALVPQVIFPSQVPPEISPELRSRKMPRDCQNPPSVEDFGP
ncbi:hypothetical protein B0H13DRAFT_1893288 [Mycena leptocephala]|nr:hypothetical protein B0H13DRAFT_1893288 [Mycena leptocephala]